MLAEGIFCISIYLLAGGSLYGKICLELQQLKIIKIVERIYIWAPFDSDFWQCYFSPFSDMWGYWESLAPKKGFAAPVLIPATFGAGFICRYQSSAEGGISSSLFCSGGNRGLEQQKKGNFFFFFLFAHNEHHRLQGIHSFYPLQLCQSALRPLLGYSCDTKSSFRIHCPATYPFLCSAEQV